MSVRIRYKITTTVSSTSSEEKDLANQAWEVVTDVYGEGGSWKTTLAPTDTDVRLYLGNIANAKFIAIRINTKDPTQPIGDVVIKKNSTSGESTIIHPFDDAKEAQFLMTTKDVTALYATNNAGTDMDITVIAVGD